jgi:hypothetical protein
MKRVRSLIAVATLATLLVVPVSSVTAAQPVSLDDWCLGPGNTVTVTISWPPNWSPVQVNSEGLALNVGDVVHVPDINPVVVKGSSYTWTWVTEFPTAEFFTSTSLSGRFDKNSGPQEFFLTTSQGLMHDCAP